MTAVYQPKLPLRDYQARELARMRGKHAWGLLMYMRTGKSCVALADFGQLELDGLADDFLLVAPAGVYLTWRGEMEKHLSDDLRGRLRVGTWVSGKGVEPGFLRDHSRPRALLVNVEALSTATGAREACAVFAEGRRVVTAVDESTAIKGHGTKRTKFVVQKLAPRSAYRRILSGLPDPRSPLDYFSQFYFLDPRILGHDRYESFFEEFAVYEKRLFAGRRWPTKVVTGYKNEDLLRERIAPWSSRVAFRPDIPPSWTLRHVPLTDEQRRAYAEMRQYATTKLGDGHVTATIVLTQMMRLHQILCGHVTDDDGQVRELPELKTAQLLELLEDYSGKAVVWVTYDADVRKVAARLAAEYGPDSVARFWGGNASTREAEEARFKGDPACRFMVATASAGGRGRTWDAADLVVYYSSSYDLEHREQSEQRVQAVGKARQVDYVDLVAPGTVEEKILHALRAKIDLSTAVSGGDWRQWVV